MPTETRAEMIDTVNMIKKIKPELYSLAILTPTPETDMYDYCLKNNLLLIKDYKDFARSSTSAKIKEVDYDFAIKAFNMSLPVSTRLRKKIRSLFPIKIRKIIRAIR